MRRVNFLMLFVCFKVLLPSQEATCLNAHSVKAYMTVFCCGASQEMTGKKISYFKSSEM